MVKHYENNLVIASNPNFINSYTMCYLSCDIQLGCPGVYPKLKALPHTPKVAGSSPTVSNVQGTLFQLPISTQRVYTVCLLRYVHVYRCTNSVYSIGSGNINSAMSIILGDVKIIWDCMKLLRDVVSLWYICRLFHSIAMPHCKACVCITHSILSNKALGVLPDIYPASVSI